MSSWVKLAVEIKDLSALEEAAHLMGFKTRHNAVGRGGYREREFELVITLPGAYDVGVSRQAGLSTNYELHADLAGRDVERAIGKDGGLLKQAYAEIMAGRIAKKQRKHVHKTKLADGTVQLTIG